MLKELAKNIDRKYLNHRIRDTRHWLVFSVWYPLISPKISKLPHGMNSIFVYQGRMEFFEAAQTYLQVNRIDGSYMEFGCHGAATFRMALNTLGRYFKPNDICHFYAFDSFQGMPEPEGLDKQKIWRKGMNFTTEKHFQRLVRRDLHRVTTTKGFYCDTLPTFNLPKDHKPALMYLDCDYYTSTMDCLNFLEDKIQHGALMAFDDWDCYYGDPERGQRKAFEEFKSRNKDRFVFMDFMKITTGGMCFIVLHKDKVGAEVA